METFLAVRDSMASTRSEASEMLATLDGDANWLAKEWSPEIEESVAKMDARLASRRNCGLRNEWRAGVLR